MNKMYTLDQIKLYLGSRLFFDKSLDEIQEKDIDMVLDEALIPKIDINSIQAIFKTLPVDYTVASGYNESKTMYGIVCGVSMLVKRYLSQIMEHPQFWYITSDEKRRLIFWFKSV